MKTDEKQPYLVRGDDGILIRNSEISVWDRRSYREPDEAINVKDGKGLRLGCNHRMFQNYSSFPCGKKPKHDPDANGNLTKCGIHSAAAIQRRQDKSNAKMQAWRDEIHKKAEISRLRDEMLPLIRAIADGHNDPRSACVEWLDRYNAAKED